MPRSALLTAADPHQPLAIADLDRPEHPVSHRGTSRSDGLYAQRDQH